MNMQIINPGESEAAPQTPNALIPRATVEDMCARRDASLALYEAAHAAIDHASAAVAAARVKAETKQKNSYNYQIDAEKLAFHFKIPTQTREEYMSTARRIVDTDFWAFIVELTDLQRIMDKKAKDQFRQELLSNPPEFTVENVFATLEQFFLDAGTIFKRGIAECFSHLDRRFRSHDGWKIGSRIILTYAFDASGWWNYRSNHEDTMIDVERVIRVLDDTPIGHCEIVSKLRDARRAGDGRRQTEIETQYFTVRAYKNGNAHLWFKRDDLLEKVNKLLGEYYGAPIPEEREAKDDGGLFNAKIVPAKHFGFYPTPDDPASAVIALAKLYRDDAKPRLTVLEPSAGTGSLARRCVAEGALVDCVEMQANFAADLKGSRLYRKVINCDFLALKPEATGLYDRVVMNPPFDLERDIDHVMHALKFLKPDGFLTAIMSAGTEFREKRKSVAFRELMATMHAQWRDLPPGSFASVGTYCNTVIMTVRKDGGSFYNN